MYQKLEGEEFRVVHLLPGEFDDEIKCVLEIRPPNIKTAYEALSYQWGHDSELKTIRIIHLRRPPSSPDNQLAEARLRSALSMVTKRFYIIFAWCYFRSLQMPIATAILYLWWVKLALMIPELVIEILETKPWRLAYKFQTADIDKDSDFVNLQVTPSLDLALRYLRYKTACRTLWIDALCINQKDEGEKQIQIRHMQAIYANAWKVVVWLGGYHGITAGDTTCTETGDCFHRRQIKKFFTVCSVWHTLYHFLPGRRFLRYLCNFRVSDHCLEEAVDGLIDISKRGWWERLWVVQEVALATGPVHVQCGDSIYEYKRFCRTMLHMTQQFSDMTALQKASAAATTFIEVTSSFGWYPDDPFSMDPLMSWLVELLYRDAAKNRIRQFRDQKPAARLQTILLRTSGHFKCRDMQDRLYAVLGIAGGCTFGSKNRCLTELVRMFGHYELRLGLFSDHPFRLCLASIIWEQFYVLVARYWPMFRPQFVIMDAKEVHQAIIGSSRDGNSQLQFFIGLAQYLATQTRRLSILDGAGCTADQNSQVPSWTPVWTRTIDKNARDFAISRDYVPPDKFHFSKDATTLTLQGRARGTITVARVINTTQPDQTQPLQRAFETWLFLPITKKMRMLAHLSFLLLSFGKIPATRRTATMKILPSLLALIKLEHIRIITLKDSDGQFLHPDGISPQAKAGLVSIRFILRLCIPQAHIASKHLTNLWIVFYSLTLFLSKCGQDTTLVYSFDDRAGELGTLKVGEAAPGDQLVFVPGCYHHLVLRRVVNEQEDVQWQLVGLVAMGPECGFERTTCTKDQWERYEREGELQTYTIA